MTTPDPARGYSEYASPSPGAAGYGYGSSTPQANVSPKSLLAAVFLCFFLGWIGAHRYYVGKIGTGLLMALLSLAGLGVGFGIGGWPWLLFGYGGMGIWALIDFITLILGAFRDKEGRLLKWS